MSWEGTVLAGGPLLAFSEPQSTQQWPPSAKTLLGSLLLARSWKEHSPMGPGWEVRFAYKHIQDARHVALETGF